MNQVQEHAASAVLSKVTYSSAGATLIFGFAANEFAAIVGASVAVLAWLTKSVMDWHFKNEHLKLAKRALKEGKLVESAGESGE